MPISHELSTELNLLIYIFTGIVTGDDYFKAYQKAFDDPRRTHGMRILVDLLTGELDYAVSDLWRGIKIMEENREHGHSPDKVAILTSTQSMRTFIDALKTMADSVPIHMDVTNNIIDAAIVLGLEDRTSELQQFWEQVRLSSAGAGAEYPGNK